MDKVDFDLAWYRLERAKNDLRSAELLYENSDFLGANNRAYYSIFNAIKAVLALKRIDFKKHKDVVGYFNKEYVKTEIFPRVIGKKIAFAKTVREDSDYDEKYIPKSETTYEQMQTAKELIKLVEIYLNEQSEN